MSNFLLVYQAATTKGDVCTSNGLVSCRGKFALVEVKKTAARRKGACVRTSPLARSLERVRVGRAFNVGRVPFLTY